MSSEKHADGVGLRGTRGKSIDSLWLLCGWKVLDCVLLGLQLSNTELCLNFVIEEDMDAQSLQCDKRSVSIKVDPKSKDMTLSRA